MITILVILTLGFLPAFVEILAEIIRKRNGKQEPPVAKELKEAE